MMNILESYDLQGFVTGETKAPPQTVVDGENGSKLHQIAKDRLPSERLAHCYSFRRSPWDCCWP
jgi:hypothetical protein